MLNCFRKIDAVFSCFGTRFWLWFSFLTLVFVYGLINHTYMMGWPSDDIKMTSADSDVWLRLTKVRELIQDGNLYNHAVVATNAPYGGVETPWTRPVDLILTFLYQFTPSDMLIEKRLILVAVWYPLLIGTLIVYAISRAAETGFKSTQKLALVFMSVLAYFLLSKQTSYFSIGNVDHHSLQTLMFVTSVWMLLSPNTLARSITMGLALGTWIWISPECLPLIFILYCIMGMSVLAKPDDSVYPILTSLTVVAITFIALLIEIPVDQIFTHIHYDRISLVHSAFFAFCSVGFMVLAGIVRHIIPLSQRVLAAGVVAAFLAIVFIAIFPKFIKGPMVDVDPFVMTNFLPRISEANPLLSMSSNIMIQFLFLPVLALIAIAHSYQRHLKLLALLCVSLLLTLSQLRWYYYLETVAMITIAQTFPSYAEFWRKKYSLRYPHHKMASVVFNPFLLFFAYGLLIYGLLQMTYSVGTKARRDDNLCQIAGFQIVSSGQLVKLLGDQSLTYESNAFVNSGVSFFTPYHYIAGPYHVEGAFGMKDQHEIFFKAEKLEDIRPLLKKRGVKAMLICPVIGKSWTNEYFNTNSPPQRDWVKVRNDVKYPPNIYTPVKPVLLMMEP